jgi:hypothetical protein
VTAVDSIHFELIRQAAARYSTGVDRCDLPMMQSAYWPDAIDDHGVFVGNAMEFCERVVSTHRRFLATMHCNANHRIDIEPEALTATGEMYNISYLHRLNDAGDGTEVDTWHGRYLDRYENRPHGDGTPDWRIIHRVCVHEWTSTAAVTPMSIPAERFRQGSEDRLV